MAEAKKINPEQLKQVQELQGKLNQVLANIGNAEVVKGQMIENHASIQAEWKDLTSKLEEEYGSVNISLEDGSISDLPKEAVEEAEVVE
jgi:predicted nuclease with TOPRIM domain